jgi:glutamyl-tRNA reductase
MSLALLGLNHKVAPVEIREQFSFSDSLLKTALKSLVDGSIIEEGVILSTCNRTEIYCSGPSLEDIRKKSKSFLGSRGTSGLSSLEECLYEFTDDEAVLHLFEVACGLDSMIVGEGQILSQVKKAFSEAQTLSFTGAVLNKLFDGAVRAGKRARNETAICQGASSISYAAVELARKIFGDLSRCRILLIGAGEMSELTVRLLVAAGAHFVMVANRTIERAREIAQSHGGQTVSFDELPEHLRLSDVIISSTAAPHHILTRETVARGVKARKGHPLFIVDIAVPRDVEPSAGEIENVYLYNIDDLQDAVNQNLVERCQEIDKVRAIIDEEIRAFSCFLGTREVVPLIKCMREGFESIAQAELDRVFSRNSLTDHEKKVLQSFRDSLLAKLLHGPTVRLKEGSLDRKTLDELRRLFSQCSDKEEEQ